MAMQLALHKNYNNLPDVAQAHDDQCCDIGMCDRPPVKSHIPIFMKTTFFGCIGSRRLTAVINLM